MKIFVFSLSLYLLFLTPAFAAKIEKLKGNRALITTDGISVKKNDELVALDSQNKRKAILKILSVKKNQAVARITRGNAEVGHSLVVAKSGASKTEKQLAEVPASSVSNFGVLGSYLINTMSAKFTVNGVSKTSNMSGTGFGVLGYYDYKITEASQLRGSAGLEQFQAAESRSEKDCNSGTATTCNVSITYLSLYGLYKYNFINAYTKFWFGGGGGYLIALSKSSSVLQTSEISTNMVLSVAGGIDVTMKKGQYLPVVIEYSFFPSSSSVSASYIALRVGWGWR